MVSIFLGICGMSMILAFSFFYYEASNTSKWSYTKGKIINIKVINEAYGSNESGYIKKVTYEYFINDQRYTSNQIHKGLNWHDISVKTAYMRKPYLIKNKSVKVYYNPTDFNDTVLENEIPLNIYVYLIAGIMSIIIAVYTL